MKIDFVHVGFHKTASTWFQLTGYPSHPQVNLINTGVNDKSFYEHFVKPDYFNFDESSFLGLYDSSALTPSTAPANCLCEKISLVTSGLVVIRCFTSTS